MPSKVATPALVSVANSAAMRIWLLDTVVSIPSPAAKVSVSPVLNVSGVPDSAARVNDDAAGAWKARLPLPSVVKMCPLLPSAEGSVNEMSDVTSGAARLTLPPPLPSVRE